MNAQPLALRLAAEALGTFLFFFLGFNAIAVATDIAGGSISPLGVAFAFGLGLAAAVAALGHVSGGHFNPAVSLGLAVARRFPSHEVVPYWIAQLVGGFVAVLAVAAVYSDRAADALDTAPGAPISNAGAIAPLVIGLFIFAAADAIGPASGGSFNPARSFDPGLYNLRFGSIWIYLLAPLTGGVVGGVICLAFEPRQVSDAALDRPARSAFQPQAEKGSEWR